MTKLLYCPTHRARHTHGDAGEMCLYQGCQEVLVANVPVEEYIRVLRLAEREGVDFDKIKNFGEELNVAIREVVERYTD